MLFVSLPNVALAEVSDKIITINQMIIISAICFIIAVMANYLRPTIYLAIPIFLLTAFFSSGGLFTVLDEFVGPDVIKEQGNIYSVVAYGSFVFVLLGNLAGYITGKRRKKIHITSP